MANACVLECAAAAALSQQMVRTISNPPLHHLRTFPKLLSDSGTKSVIVKEGLGVDYSAIEYRAFELAEKNQMFFDTQCFCREDIFANPLS